MRTFRPLQNSQMTSESPLFLSTSPGHSSFSDMFRTCRNPWHMKKDRSGRVVVHGLLLASLLTKIASEMHYMARTFECARLERRAPHRLVVCRFSRSCPPTWHEVLLLTGGRESSAWDSLSLHASSSARSITFSKPVFSGDTVTCTCTLQELGEGAVCDCRRRPLPPFGPHHERAHHLPCPTFSPRKATTQCLIRTRKGWRA